MKQMSKKLKDMLSEFVIREVGAKVLDGITYTFVESTDKEKYKEYNVIREEATDNGFGGKEIIRVFKVSNGYIYDLDIDIAKAIAQELYKVVAKDNKLSINESENPNFRIIGETPKKRRIEEIEKISKYILNKARNGEMDFEVALFSRNKTNQIIINGIDGDSGDRISIRYNAYALRHYDLEIVNERYLIPAGYRVCNVKPLEILPSKTGVSFNIRVQTMEEFIGVGE